MNTNTMATLKEKAAEYDMDGYNCAECILHAANEQWQLGLSEADMRLVSGFGAGMQCGDICGALTASVCVISRKIVRTKAHDCPALQPLVQQMISAFEQAAQARTCARIRPRAFNETTRCLTTVETAADILEQLMHAQEEMDALM